MSENSEMSQNSEYEAEKQRSTEPSPAVEGDSGQYVDGDYGSAGIAGEETAATGGEYPDGDYGAAGIAGEGEEHRLVEDEVPVEEETQDEDLPGD